MRYNLKIFNPAVLAVVLLLLAAPHFAQAFVIPNPFEIVSQQLDAIEEISAPIMKLTTQIFFTYLAAIISLFLAASTLDWIIANPGWLNLSGPAVTVGWDMTRGLANMFLLLLFVVIAFGFILRIESVESRKSLPRLIIVALLINFSKLFVGMIVDMATIAHNTIIYGHENLVLKIMKGILAGMYGTLAQLGMWIATTVITMAIPLAGGLKQVIVAASIASKGLAIASFPLWIMQLSVAFELTGILLLYIFLFAARVYIVQILAILSPFAFLCLILPQTQKYWSEWLKHLIQWAFLGVVLLFFLTIGLTSSQFILPGNDTPLSSASKDSSGQDLVSLGSMIPILNVPRYFSYYSFLFIYLAVTVWLVDRTMPMIAVAIIGFATGMAGKAWKSYGQPASGMLKNELNRSAAAVQDRQKAIKEGKVTLEGMDYLKHQAARAALAPVLGAHRLLQTTPSQAVSTEIDQGVTKFETKYGKDDDAVDRAMSTLNLKNMDSGQKMAFAQWGMKYKGSDFVQDLDKEGHLDNVLGQAAIHRSGVVKEAVGYMPQKLDGEMAPQLKRAILSGNSGRKEIERMQEVHGLDTPDEEIETKAAFSQASKKILGNKEKIGNWNDDALKHEGLQEAIIANANTSDIQNIGEKHGQAVVDSIHGELDKMKPEVAVKLNAKFMRATVNTSAVRAIFPPHEKIQYEHDDQNNMILDDQNNPVERKKEDQLKKVDEMHREGRQQMQQVRTQRQTGQTGQTRRATTQTTFNPGGQTNFGNFQGFGQQQQTPGGGQGFGPGAGTPPGGTGRGAGRQQPGAPPGGAGPTPPPRGGTPPGGTAGRQQQPGQTNLGNFGNAGGNTRRNQGTPPPGGATGGGTNQTTQRRTTQRTFDDDIIPGADNAPPNRDEY